MSMRLLAVSLGISGLLALAGTASLAQDPAGTPKTDTPKTDAPKGDSTDEGAKPEPVKPKLEAATFGGGCFWCLEAFFERVPGVTNVVSGFAGGNVTRPTYEMVCTGLTGHAEVVEITFDANIVSYEDLVEVFFQVHDPTTLNRQGVDEGPQYRSIILFHNEEQRKTAIKVYEKLTSSHAFANDIVTQLVPFTKFWPAEKYHQDYFRRNRGAAYCQNIIAPKLRELIARQKLTPKSKQEH
jgi:peptide-methionine (S)-S-oxide reductase